MDIEKFAQDFERVARKACKGVVSDEAQFRLAYLCGGVQHVALFNGSTAAARIAAALELVLKGSK